MNWKYLFTSLEGRIGRKSFWMGLIPIIVITIVTVAIDLKLGTMSEYGFGVVSGIAAWVLLYPAIMLYAKRWHDRNKSGWWTLINFVPIIGGLWLLIELGFLRGTDGPNRFGPDPLR